MEKDKMKEEKNKIIIGEDEILFITNGINEMKIKKNNLDLGRTLGRSKSKQLCKNRKIK